MLKGNNTIINTQTRDAIIGKCLGLIIPIISSGDLLKILAFVFGMAITLFLIIFSRAIKRIIRKLIIEVGANKLDKMIRVNMLHLGPEPARIVTILIQNSTGSRSGFENGERIGRYFGSFRFADDLEGRDWYELGCPEQPEFWNYAHEIRGFDSGWHRTYDFTREYVLVRNNETNWVDENRKQPIWLMFPMQQLFSPIPTLTIQWRGHNV